jgi:hypothetical protein
MLFIRENPEGGRDLGRVAQKCRERAAVVGDEAPDDSAGPFVVPLRRRHWQSEPRKPTLGAEGFFPE